jgi:hypothetical protein
LFGGKYTGWLHSLQQCRGFVLGVEVVLDHMTKTTADSGQSVETTAA